MSPGLRLLLTGIAAIALAAGTVAVWAVDDDPSPPPMDLAEQGHFLFATKGCVACHTGPDRANDSQGPRLTNLADVAAIRQPGVPAETYVRESILNPQAHVVPDYSWLEMPVVSLTTDEADALVAYLLPDTQR